MVERERARRLIRGIGFVMVSLLCLAFLVPSCTLGLTPGTFYRGVNMHPLELKPAQQDVQLDLASQLGANVVRINLGWQVLEADGKGRLTRPYLDRADHFMAGAQARGIQVILVLYETPCWASSAPETIKLNCAPGSAERGVGIYPPKDPKDYADMASFLVSRYRSTLAALEVWNEPNLAGFFAQNDAPAAYARLLKATYPAVKAADPGVRVLGASLSEADRPFLEALYANGIRGSYDAISVHPYNGNLSPYTDYGNPKSSFLRGLKWIREAQLAAGDTSPVWADEFGWNTSVARNGTPYDGVDPDTQAAYLRAAYGLIADPRQGLDFVQGAVMYDLHDDGPDPNNAEHNLGLVKNDYRPKPSYFVLRDVFTNWDGFVTGFGQPAPQSTGPQSPGPQGTGTDTASGTPPRRVGTPRSECAVGRRVGRHRRGRRRSSARRHRRSPRARARCGAAM